MTCASQGMCETQHDHDYPSESEDMIQHEHRLKVKAQGFGPLKHVLDMDFCNH